MKISNPKQDSIAVTVENVEVKEQRQMWGTTRTLIANAIQGMTEGFTTPLYLVGVGFRAAVEADPRALSDGAKAQRINMKVGHSHNIVVPIPPHIKVELPIPTKIVLSCTDKHLLGLFAAKIREYRKPEPYKGKVHSDQP
jgi:large subunit ribosomal protein L6